MGTFPLNRVPFPCYTVQTGNITYDPTNRAFTFTLEGDYRVDWFVAVAFAAGDVDPQFSLIKVVANQEVVGTSYSTYDQFAFGAISDAAGAPVTGMEKRGYALVHVEAGESIVLSNVVFTNTTTATHINGNGLTISTVNRSILFTLVHAGPAARDSVAQGPCPTPVQ